MSGSWSQVVSCRDFADREREVRICVIGDGIVLKAPPGEAICLTADESRFLRAALADAERHHHKGVHSC
jgi:hypothetical protein